MRILVLVVGLVSGLIVAPRGATASDEVLVRAGAVHPERPRAPYEFTRYYPDVMQVHRGQTVRWDFVGSGVNGFHTVTFSDAGATMRRPDFVRPDELPGSIATTQGWSAGSGCGRAGSAPCALDASTSWLSSGPPMLDRSPFRVTIDLPAGSYSYFCTIHPTMRGQVDVVDDADPIPTQAEIDADVAHEVAQDAAAADALVEAGQTPGFTIEDGHRVWTVRTGTSTADDHVAVLQYLPGALEVSPGDAVHFRFDPGIVNEIHTVTFPNDAVGGFSPFPHGLGGWSFDPSCDVDAPEAGLPGVPGPWFIVSCPSNLEWILAPWMFEQQRAPNDEIATAGVVHNSAILVPGSAPEFYRGLPPGSGRHFPSTFEAAFPVAGSFTYGCEIHPGQMSARIDVA